MSPHDDYKRLDLPAGATLMPCPVCKSDAEIWQYSESETAATRKAVCCSFKETFGPQDGILNEGCLLYMPPDGFYQPTIRDAIKYWNEYAKALGILSRKNGWSKHKAFRAETKDAP